MPPVKSFLLFIFHSKWISFVLKVQVEEKTLITTNSVDVKSILDCFTTKHVPFGANKVDNS
jgi:hypothetical protein